MLVNFPPLATSMASVTREVLLTEKVAGKALAYPNWVMTCQISSKLASEQEEVAAGPEQEGRISSVKRGAVVKYPAVSRLWERALVQVPSLPGTTMEAWSKSVFSVSLVRTVGLSTQPSPSLSSHSASTEAACWN